MKRLPEPFLILLQAIRNAGYRLPVLVEGDADWCYAWVLDCLVQLDGDLTKSAADPADVLWYSHRAPQGAWRLSEKRVQHELGREANHLVFDCFAGINVDALAAMSGTLKKGGCMFLLLPPLTELDHFDDPYNNKLAVVPWGIEQVTRHYLARLRRLLESSKKTVRIRQGCQAIYPEQLPIPIIQAPYEVRAGLQSDRDVVGVTVDQGAAVQAVLKVLKGHRNRPLVLIADRGRGKSSAIGLALKTVRGQGKTVLVTAPRPESVETLFSFAGQPASEKNGPDNLHFYAPDHLLDNLPAGDMLVIDEAAAIAPGLLKRMLMHYSRVVMATTVQGYEGTGRGFEIRFSKFLDQSYPGWKPLRLMQPIRWQEGDWLEELINAILMPSNSMASKTCWSTDDNKSECLLPISESELSFRSLQFDGLTEPELAEIFDLLTNAHYRTRPSDLRTLMDAANVRSYEVKSNGRLLGIAMIAVEGQIDGDLAAKILAGQRRPNGQILPQSMAVHLGVESALELRFWRIVRIAVQPEYQSLGLGTKLVHHVQNEARRESVDAIGSVFSATPELLSFWQKNQMSLLRIGYTREATSGGYSALVMHPFSSKANVTLNLAKNRFTADLTFSLLGTHRHLPVEMVLKVVSMALTQRQAGTRLMAHDQQFVKDYLAGCRVYENGSASLWRWVWHWLNENVEQWASLRAFPELVVLRVLQNLTWPEVIDRLQLTGQKQARLQLREALLQLTTLDSESEP